MASITEHTPIDHRRAIERAGDGVRTGLRRSIDELFGPGARPKDLIEVLGLDKSLAGRTMRASRGSSAAAAVVDGPSVPGLLMFVDAAERAGLSPPTAAVLRNAITDLSVALRAFPGGRSGVAAAMGTSGPPGVAPERLDSERRARQSVFRAMTALAGVQLETFYIAYFYHPSPDGIRCDGAWVSSHQGFKRLKPDSSLSMGRSSTIRTDDRPPDRLALDGTPLGRDPRDALLPEFCDGAIDQLDLISGAESSLLVAPPGVPALGEEMTVTTGIYSPGFMPRYAQPNRPYNCMMATPVRPTRRLIADHLVHRDLFPGGPPTARSWFETAAERTLLERPELGQTDIVEQEIRMTEVPRASGRGENLASPEVWRAGDIVAYSFDALGWDPTAFRGYRLEVDYPVMRTSVAAWFRLPGAPPA